MTQSDPIICNPYRVIQNFYFSNLQHWPEHSENAVLLRLEHLFETHEDPQTNSRPVTLQLDKLFKAFEISGVEEVTLGANLAKEKLERLEWNVVNEVPSTEIRPGLQMTPENGWSLTLQPFQIRTFIINLTPKT